MAARENPPFLKLGDQPQPAEVLFAVVAQKRLIGFILVLALGNVAYRLVYLTGTSRTAALFVGIPTLLAIGLALLPRSRKALAVTVCLIPGLLLGQWTANGDHLTARVTLQAAAFAGLLLLVLPALALETTGGSWAALLDRPRWQFVVAVLLLAPPAAMALQAVAELAFHGGTPVPLDPPARLATTGPYAYVANPMQLGATVVLAGWGVLLASLPVVLGAAVAGAFSAGFASWNEDGDLAARFGDDWRRYRASVRLWLPRLRPAPGPAAVLYVDAGCGPCSDVGAFVTRRRRSGLVVAPAATCPEPLRRIAYRTEAGRRLDGVAALAGALEHTHLGWAVACWIARLPGVVHVLQLVTDVVGGGPRVPAHLVADVDVGIDPL